jgi:hypothetical protein
MKLKNVAKALQMAVVNNNNNNSIKREVCSYGLVQILVVTCLLRSNLLQIGDDMLTHPFLML